MKKFLRYKIPLWLLLGVIIVAVLTFLVTNIVDTYREKAEHRATVQRIEEVSEIVFLNAQIKDIINETNSSRLPYLNIEIPFSEKRVLAVINYKAKLGIKEGVTVEELEENTYRITVPKFQVIGVDVDENNGYELYDSSGELLSLATEDIDVGKILSERISSQRQAIYLAQYNEELKNSATTYFETLFNSIDPDINLEIKFN